MDGTTQTVRYYTRLVERLRSRLAACPIEKHWEVKNELLDAQKRLRVAQETHAAKRGYKWEEIYG